jgi:hypothetical protein
MPPILRERRRWRAACDETGQWEAVLRRHGSQPIQGRAQIDIKTSIMAHHDA